MKNIDAGDRVVYADSAYVGEKLQEELEKKNTDLPTDSVFYLNRLFVAKCPKMK